MKIPFNSRNFKYGTASTLFIALFVVAVIVFNILAGFLTERFSLKLDMTSEGKYTLSSQTTEMLKNLSGDVNIYILSTRAEMEKGDNSRDTLEMIQRYASESGGRVSYEFVDPNKNPKFFEKYPDARNSDKKALVVEGEKRYKVLQSSEFAFRLSENSNKIFYQTEEKISSAIMFVSSGKETAAGFVQGHNEIVPTALANIFAGNNFSISAVDLRFSVPEGITNLVIAAPTVDFSASEIENLEAFLSRDGANLYVFWDSATGSLPVLERYLAEWGFGFETYLICDESAAYTSPDVIVASLYDNEIIDSSSQGELMPIFPRTRPIKLDFVGENGYMRTVPLLASSDSSYGKLLSSDKKITTLSREKGDEAGPFVVASVTERLIGSMGKNGLSRVIAFGSVAFTDNSYAGIQRAFNSALLSDTVSYSNDMQTLYIMPKVESEYDLDITEGTIRVLHIVLIYVMPLLIFALGIFVFIRRKNR